MPCCFCFVPGRPGSCLPVPRYNSACPGNPGIVSVSAGARETAGLPKKGQRKEIENEMEERTVVFSYSPNQKVRCMPTETSASLLCFSRHLVQFQRPWSSKPEARLIRVELSSFPNTFKQNNFEKNKESMLLTLKVEEPQNGLG